MFASLSFKKLRRRIRAITLFKKFSKKSKSKQKAAKQQDKFTDDVEQPSVHAEPGVESASSPPNITVEFASSLEASSGSETTSLPTPVKAVQLPVDTIDKTHFRAEDDQITKEQKAPFSNYPQIASVEESIQGTQSTKQDPVLNESASVPTDYCVASKPLVADDVDQDQTAASLHDPEPVRAALLVQDRQNKVDEPLDTPQVPSPVDVEEPAESTDSTEICRPIDVKEPARGAETVVDHASPVVNEPVQHEEITEGVLNKAADVELPSPPVVDRCAPESPRPSRATTGDDVEHISSQPPQTPRSTRTIDGPLRTPSASPRKRVASEVRVDQDASIMSELQASVRSREKRRLEKEKMEAEEKKREERELRQSVAATMGREFTEMGVWKTDEPADRETVLREVRSWRKQRESSFKGKVDDPAAEKAAAFREALSNEEIMVDLMSAVQSRSLRASCFVDPREKRQTLLEDLFARRVHIGQA